MINKVYCGTNKESVGNQKQKLIWNLLINTYFLSFLETDTQSPFHC